MTAKLNGVKCFSLLRGEEHREIVAELCRAHGFTTISQYYRWRDRMDYEALQRAKQARAQELPAETSEAPGYLKTLGQSQAWEALTHPNSVLPIEEEPPPLLSTDLFPPFATEPEPEETFEELGDEVNPFEADDEEDLDPDEFNEDEAPEAYQPSAAELSALLAEAAAVYIDDLSDEEAAAFLARLLPALLCHCDEAPLFAELSRLQASEVSPQLLPHALACFVVRRVQFPYRE